MGDWRSGRALPGASGGVSGLKTILRFNSAQLYLALNRGVPDEVVQKLHSELDKMPAGELIDIILNSYL